MEIHEGKKDGVVILDLNGRLDALTSNSLEEKFLTLIEAQEKHFAVNFLHVNYISSGGLRVLLKAAKILKKANGRIVLFGLKDYIKEIFELAGFVSLFSIYSDEALALQSFQFNER